MHRRIESGCKKGRAALKPTASLPRMLLFSAQLLSALIVLFAARDVGAQVFDTHQFVSLNRMIPDGNAAGLSDVREITSTVASIASLRVTLRLRGEFNGDLFGYLRLVNATGTNYCVLLNRPGRTLTGSFGYDDSGLDVTFDDAATNGDVHLYRKALGAFDGSLLTGAWNPDGRASDPQVVLDSDTPATSLSSFAGADASGQWTLFLADLECGGTNMLEDWGLEVTGSPRPAATLPLLPVPDQKAFVLMSLCLTNRLSDSCQWRGPMSFGLMSGAPTGARIGGGNGVFCWTPSLDQARTTNVIRVWAQDSSSPPSCATNAFTVVVDDFVELALGRAILGVGQSGAVPVHLTASVGLTNVSALVRIPENRLLPMTLSHWAPEVSDAILQQQDGDLWRMEFFAAPGQALPLDADLAQFEFQSVTNTSSFVPLILSDLANLQTNGIPVWRGLLQPGRAVVVDGSPLLEALPFTNGQPDLLLYAAPGARYHVLFSPTIGACATWQPVWTGTVTTNLWLNLPGITNTGSNSFYQVQPAPSP